MIDVLLVIDADTSTFAWATIPPTVAPPVTVPVKLTDPDLLTDTDTVAGPGPSLNIASGWGMWTLECEGIAYT